MTTKLRACVIVATLVASALVGRPGTARADNLEEAKGAFAEGRTAFERGDYERALSQFQRANLLAPAPSLSYNIGKTYEKLGRFRDAVLAFERYLELMGAPSSDEDKKFQEDLKLRIEADRKLPDRSAQTPQPYQPQPQPQPYQPQPQPQPYYNNNPYQPAYNPYAYSAPMVNPRQVRLDAARRKRNGGITQLIVGGSFLIIGAALTADACARSIGCSFRSTNSLGVSNSTNNVNASVELVFSVPSLIVGAIVMPIGIANLVKGQADLTKVMKEPPDKAEAGILPQAFMFSTPPVYF